MDKIIKSEQEWAAELNSEQFNICRKRALNGHFQVNTITAKRRVYTAVPCGAELFDAATKYDSGSGLAQFLAPINTVNGRKK